MEKWLPVSTTPGTGAVGDVASEGIDPRVARADHKHGREAFATPVAITPDAAAAPGTATTLVRSDHQHGITTYTATPAAVTATGSAGTSGTAPVRGDHSHALGIGTTRGDVIVWNSVPTPVRLALGANGTVLQSNGSDLVYAASPTPAFVSMAKWYTD